MIMKLRFKLDQGDALRQGVDAPTSVVTIEVNPTQLMQEERNLLADRMDGIDVRQLRYSAGEKKPYVTTDHITANLGNYEALMAAVRANDAQCQSGLKEQARATTPDRSKPWLRSTAWFTKPCAPSAVLR